jgi:hypothetical protein
MIDLSAADLSFDLIECARCSCRFRLVPVPDEVNVEPVVPRFQPRRRVRLGTVFAWSLIACLVGLTVFALTFGDSLNLPPVDAKRVDRIVELCFLLLLPVGLLFFWAFWLGAVFNFFSRGARYFSRTDPRRR